MDEQKRPKLQRKRLSFNREARGTPILKGLVLTPGIKACTADVKS